MMAAGFGEFHLTAERLKDGGRRSGGARGGGGGAGEGGRDLNTLQEEKTNCAHTPAHAGAATAQDGA